MSANFTTRAYADGELLTANKLRELYSNAEYLKGRGSSGVVELESRLSVQGSMIYTSTGNHIMRIQRIPTSQESKLKIEGYTPADPDVISIGDEVVFEFSMAYVDGSGTTTRRKLGSMGYTIAATSYGATMHWGVWTTAGTTREAVASNSTGGVTLYGLGSSSTEMVGLNADKISGLDWFSPIVETTIAGVTPGTAWGTIDTFTLTSTGTWMIMSSVEWAVGTATSQDIYIRLATTAGVAISTEWQMSAKTTAASHYGSGIWVNAAYNSTSASKNMVLEGKIGTATPTVTVAAITSAVPIGV